MSYRPTQKEKLDMEEIIERNAQRGFVPCSIAQDPASFTFELREKCEFSHRAIIHEIEIDMYKRWTPSSSRKTPNSLKYGRYSGKGAKKKGDV